MPDWCQQELIRLWTAVRAADEPLSVHAAARASYSKLRDHLTQDAYIELWRLYHYYPEPVSPEL